MLVEYFVRRYAARAGKHFGSIDKKTLNLLQNYDWPGNIRELQNVIERSVILNAGEVFAVDPSWLSKQPARRQPAVASPVPPQGEPRSEREMIEAALAVQGSSRRAVRGGSEARRSTIHTRSSDQGVAHQQDPVQVSVTPHELEDSR
jgi:DNA-binding NtrC family response regulator